ncbi:hypothetical protein PISMIDRAFT_12159 [Pisolithus microcarpus 441]|uniref:Unplaced genomic scaffold scaffold_65, whole genome shotgun sequence n=1 Tax=Pisolithus microcarpus 441 TaxID=765257 RepID=A0A0C9YAB7_9AGAM|nr:hypothetical protein BKA83DRAFT_12159 [Pisolithus microcarpus]KIK21665.1 hypothetical protein PISMIDRAFT_12159 [Pisolithus microcarpus 441]
MPTYTKGHPYMDKENFDVEGQGPWAHRPSEKQRLLTSEQQELVQHPEVGSENGGSDGGADEDQSADNDNDDDGDIGSQEIATRLSGVAKEGLTYSKNKVPKPLPATIDIDVPSMPDCTHEIGS